MAGRGIVIVVEVVVPQQFFSGGDVADGKNPHSGLDLVDLAVGIAGMVQVGPKPFAIDDRLAIFQSVEISARRAIVESVGFLGSDARAIIFDDASTFANWRSGKDSCGVNARRTDNQGHTTNFACFSGLKEEGMFLQGQAFVCAGAA